jgi:hypothetical protein
VPFTRAIASRALPIGGLLLLVAAALRAESLPKSRHRLGPVRVWPALTLQTLVDSNPYGLGSVGNGDLLVIVSPSLEALWPIGSRLKLSGEGRLDWNQYRRNDARSYGDWFGSATAELEMGRATLYADAGGLQVTQVYGIALENGTLQQQSTLGAGARVRVTRRLSARAEARFRAYRHWQPDPRSTIRQDLDRDALSATAFVDWALTRRTSVFGSLEDMEEQFVYAFPGFPSAARSRRWLAGLSFAPGAAVRGRVGFGMISTPAEGIIPNYQGPLSSATIEIPLRRAARLLMGVDRDIRFAAAGVPTLDPSLRNVQALKSYRLGIEGELPGELVGRAAARWEEARYLIPFLAPGRVTTRTDRLFEVTGSVGRPLRRSLWVGAVVEYTQRVTNVGYGDWRWRYGLRASVGRPSSHLRGDAGAR